MADLEEAVRYSFYYFYHLDKANACVHKAQVKYSPITFELARVLFDIAPTQHTAVNEVLSHVGKYELDPGR